MIRQALNFPLTFPCEFYAANMLRRLFSYPALILTALITLYKASVRPHLNYGDIIYDQAHNASFHQKYNACLAITGAIRGSSREKIYQELGFESLQQCRW